MAVRMRIVGPQVADVPLANIGVKLFVIICLYSVLVIYGFFIC